jgi:hypothetical protein
MAEPTRALHKALKAQLDTLCSCSVYDGVPQEAVYPYVVLDFMTTNNEDYTNARQDRRFVYLSVWSRNHGQEEVMDIIEQIDAINETNLSLDTGDAFSVRVERKQTNREPDNLTFMGQVTLRVLTTH